MDRARRKEELDKAYELQSKAAMIGAARYTGVGFGLAVIGHYSWPLFRRQTLAFKGFLVSAFTIFGLVLSAESALLSHEAEKRQIETQLRREARIDLARRGRVATETEIARWKEERVQRMQAESQPDPQTASGT
ncbi:hypothetical protein B0H21DRAFT_717329 [Amylocystis lapponica]|nr:hypothetical protein B0H21DRAFT_717329 [Amylocystis lapponica]